PEYIVKYIVENTLGKIDIINNPFVTVIDISCGVGYFLLHAYDLLMEKFIKELELLREAYKDETYIIKTDGVESEIKGLDYWIRDNLHYHILKHCIYGADKDNFAVELTRGALYSKGVRSPNLNSNILHCDSLIRWENEIEGMTNETNTLKKFWSRKYDFVVGNPPYIGHKQLDIGYKKWLMMEYKEVFKDKADISFAFIKRTFEVLKAEGVAGIITSRYFMENPTGRKLREYILENGNMVEILDFYGASIFKGVGVATGIFIFSKEANDGGDINVTKLIDDEYTFTNLDNLSELINTNVFEKFSINKEKLGTDRWILLSPVKRRIYEKIQRKSNLRLRDVVHTFQGVITGGDKAFVLTEEEIERYEIERILLKKWIKNSSVQRYNISEGKQFLIYSDLIGKMEDFPNAVGYIRNFQEKLQNRRECKNGSREWYKLQWGRDTKLFEQRKLIFPYKARENRFALDEKCFYFSADIYSMIVKDEYKYIINLEYLLGILNSRIYEFYFKLFGKKIGKGTYDYYPNAVLDILISTDDIMQEIEMYVLKILDIKRFSAQADKEYEKAEIFRCQMEIDRIVGEYFNLNEEEIELIVKSTKREYDLS
ncbi:MAG: N-6 DNA methylase, partial [Tissierellaceae bacterium]